jgi:hypothetical protein
MDNGSAKIPRREMNEGEGERKKTRDDIRTCAIEAHARGEGSKKEKNLESGPFSSVVIVSLISAKLDAGTLQKTNKQRSDSEKRGEKTEARRIERTHLEACGVR